MTYNSIFQRTDLLLGEESMHKVRSKRVIIFGVGGVGSWCAESLVRSGIEHLTIVDSDNVCESNINRQLMATTATIGQSKVEILRQRLLQINPMAEVVAKQEVYTAETADSFRIQDYDYVIDAIDSLQHKAHLILYTTRLGITLFSSMGAALKFDPTRIKVDEFWKVKGCPLAASLRRRFKRNHTFPERKFMCVYSDELLRDRHQAVIDEQTQTQTQINGTIMHITAMFGLLLAWCIIRDIVNK